MTKQEKGFNPKATQLFYVVAGIVAAVAALVGVLRVEDVDALVAIIVALGGLVGAGAPFWAASNVHSGSRSTVTDEDLEQAERSAQAAEEEVTALRRALGAQGETINQEPGGRVRIDVAPAEDPADPVVDPYEAADYRPEVEAWD